MRPLAFAACFAALPAQALELTLTGFYELNRPASLDYDPVFCGLWIANEGPEVVLVTLDGLELKRFGSDLFRIKAVSVEGDNLLVADGAGNFQRLTKSGGILAEPFRTDAQFPDTEGVVVTEDGTLITVEDDPARLSWLAPDGTVIRQIDALTLDPPLSEPQGIARDPRTGHLLIVDDWEGTNSLYEFDENGQLLATLPLIEYGLDPEGIAIRPGAGQLFMAFDQGARIASFEYTPTLSEGEALPPGADCMMM
ncbi:MAG: hypothetical protein AAFR35_02565 [Pseudomonadota bacterium]